MLLFCLEAFPIAHVEVASNASVLEDHNVLERQR